MRMYEIKMWNRDTTPVLIWKFFIHEDGIEIITQPSLITSNDRQLLDSCINTMMSVMKNLNIGDMQCKFIA